MPRDVGWGDESVGNRGPDKERQYRGVKGETHVIRVMTTCKEVRVHFVDDILDPDKDGEARGFWMNCSREWDESEEEWVGDCMGCDREYTVSSKFVAGISRSVPSSSRGSCSWGSSRGARRSRP